MNEKELQAKSHKESLLIVNSICGSQFLLETLESLKGTWYYKQQFKSITNRFVQIAEETTKNAIDFAFERDEEIIQDTIESITNINKRLSRLRPDEIILVDTIIQGIENDTLEIIPKTKKGKEKD